MVIPGTLDLAVLRGDTWTMAITLQVNGTPVDLDGCALLAQCRAGSALDAPVLIDFHATQGDDTGKVELSIDQDVVDVLPVKQLGRWDLQVTDTDGVVTTYVQGKVTVTADYSRVEA